MAKRLFDIPKEDILLGVLEPWEIVEPMYDAVDTENTETYERTVSAFTLPQRLVFAVETYISEVNNGGHDQFFYNSSGVVLKDALEGLRAMGLDEIAALLERVVAKVDFEIPGDVTARREAFEDTDDELFETEDDEFYEIEEGVDDVIMNYIRANVDSFTFRGEIETLD